MALHDKVAEIRRRTNGTPDEFQGVGRTKIKQVLDQLHLGSNKDLVDLVFALLDNETASWFAKAPRGSTISDGAATSHLACHIGILQRNSGKLDREGRDYWIKPLRDLGGIEAITLHEGEFIAGHVTAKSPNSSYRLNEEFRTILMAPNGQWEKMLSKWASENAARERHAFQAEMAKNALGLVDSSHADLIKASVDYYAKRFLPGYTVLYTDDSDGDRIADEERALMKAAGVDLMLGDGMPDVLLWNAQTDHLWVIEAVTSDGEVDMHKVSQLTRLAERYGKSGVGFTTTYRTWKEAAARQGKHTNIAVETYIWIQGDPAKQFKVEG